MARALAAILGVLLMAAQEDTENFPLELWNLQSSPEPLSSGLLLAEKSLKSLFFPIFVT